MKFAEKLWKKTKLAGKEVVKNTQVVENTSQNSNKQQETASQNVVKSALNERKVARVLAWLEKYNVKEDEIEKLTDAEIETICDGLRTAQRTDWGSYRGDSFMLNKKKIATWGEYDIYFAKTARTRRKDNYQGKTGFNELCLENYIFITKNDGHIVSALLCNNENFDIDQYECIITAYTDREYDDEKIDTIAFYNACLQYENIKYSENRMLSRYGKVMPLCYAASNAASKHYTISSLFLRKDDKIIKNSLENISREYEILPNGEMKAINNWQLLDEDDNVEGELLGLKKQNGQNVVDESEYPKKFKAEFDSNKNYGDISLYAQQNESGEFEIQANDDDREDDWKWKKIAVSPSSTQPILQITVFDKVRKQEIINSKAEVESVHFFDANNFELAGNFKFDKTQTKFEDEIDCYYCGGGHCSG